MSPTDSESFMEDETRKAVDKALASGMDAVVIDAPGDDVIVVNDVSALPGVFARMREADQTALAGASDRQLAIGWGDCFARLYDDDNGIPLLIFGKIPTEEEFWAVEGQDPEERSWQEKHRRDVEARGYRFAWCYSVACPDGEPGDTHVSQMQPITTEEFEQAREAGWKPAELVSRHGADSWIVDIVYGERFR